MPQHAMITILLTAILAVLLFLAGISPVLIAGACVAFFGLRNDV